MGGGELGGGGAVVSSSGVERMYRECTEIHERDCGSVQSMHFLLDW